MRKYAISALAGLALLSGCVAVPESSGYAPAPVYVAPAPMFYGPSLFYGVEGHRHNYGGRNGRRDSDGDGIPNYRDRDRDGDGVRNSRDRQPDNPRRY